MEDDRLEEGLDQLRGIVGQEPTDAALRSLLGSCKNDVEQALNRFYESRHVEPAVSAHVQHCSLSHAAPGAGKQLKINSNGGCAAANKKRKLAAPEQLEPRVEASTAAPLAERMRPVTVGQLVGQDDALGTTLRTALANDKLPSLVLWGPPGCGKTSFAACVAHTTKRIFRRLSAADAGINQLRAELERARNAERLTAKKTILFVDELHRWSKAQQDGLLADCEKGTVTLIGATTENPSFSLNNAVMSRCRLVVFGKLSPQAMGCVLERACTEDAALQSICLTAGAQQAIISAADGDARVALNALELAAAARMQGEVDTAAVHAAIQRTVLYDRNGDMHYDLISALHKSMRGGDADGAVYYASRMLHGGEEPRYITRRLIRFASEDIGLADPQALAQAVAVDQAVHTIGMPEAGVIIAQGVIYMALAPKSCAVYRAYNAAMQACRKEPTAAVPLHIRNAPTAMMNDLGYSKGYVYNPSDGYKRGCVEGYLPPALGADRAFFDRNDCEVGNKLKFCTE